MAFIIKCKDREEAAKVATVIGRYLANSRFYLARTGAYGNPGGITINSTSRGATVSITGIRLKTPKGYCGNHAGPCRLTGRKHNRAAFLEGLDWVSWNDMLNDALDSVKHDGDAGSGTCKIRKGRQRRIDYLGKQGGEFDRDTDASGYQDRCGTIGVISNYEWGTPGIIGWEANRVESPYEEAIS